MVHLIKAKALRLLDPSRIDVSVIMSRIKVVQCKIEFFPDVDLVNIDKIGLFAGVSRVTGLPFGHYKPHSVTETS